MPSPLPLFSSYLGCFLRLTLAIGPYAVTPHARLRFGPFRQLHGHLRFRRTATRDEEALLHLRCYLRTRGRWRDGEMASKTRMYYKKHVERAEFRGP